MRARRIYFVAVCVLLIAGCAHLSNLPSNLATADANAGLSIGGEPIVTSDDDLLIALAFSGGGTRAGRRAHQYFQSVANLLPFIIFALSL